MGPCQVLLLRVRVDLGTMAMKGCSALPKAPVLLEPHPQIIQPAQLTGLHKNTVKSVNWKRRKMKRIKQRKTES